ncbi:MAG: Rieske (2Fe-2S) protein [Verrucomicrobia bacterium]|nr:Rieske (2Fe-2S) protein [Verrucomicrobiota bacterium]
MTTSTITLPDGDPSQGPTRRGFLRKLLSLVCGGLAGLVPAAAGLVTFLDPLHRRSAAGGFVRVASLETLPADGIPRKFAVVSDRRDAWNRFPHVPIGAVYLRRTGAQAVEALNAVCPHAGCFVDYVPIQNGFLCPCHNSRFAADGRLRDSRSPSPRGLDTLEVQVRDGTEIWVRFQNFRAGQAAKIAVA